MGNSETPLPRHYRVGRAVWAKSRWIVFYKGDPEFFVEKVNALGEERIKTFATKKTAIEAIVKHEEYVAKLNAMPQP